MGAPISNASNTPLPATANNVPNVQNAIMQWLQPLTFEQIEKKIVNFQVVETPTVITFKGVWQPFTAQQLFYKPEGQRAWKWFTCHAEPGTPLKPDDVVDYLDGRYRVKEKMDYTLYGYIEYHLVEDYVQGEGA
jgi:hypothetical protein